MEYRVLGSLDVIRDDGSHAVFGRLERRLTAVLLVFAGDACSRDMLIRALWGDSPPARPDRALGICLCRARAAIGPGSCLRSLDELGVVKLRSGSALCAVPRQDELDLARFTQLRGAALRLLEHGHLRPASQALEQALACWHEPAPPGVDAGKTLTCWRDPPLADLPDAPEAAARRTRLLEQRNAAWLTLADVLLELGDHARLLPRLRAKVIADPICERAWAQLMLALHQAGRRGEALAA
jgi:DNA-binding SARP family transcriptional activator